ncbi:hypothetical protein GOP47_0023507 [Adiantum capillus-veneris]|uniref:Dolichyl-diphosphooligosaccharide--protein glycosyltransferase subunit 1 n=1 Tax=Adiantum capillus-veneris TaxID=13818 RepID=A0A9D4U4N1_ADICA|nr:hypothetical protein GOP47_0023507 [Adiantum capillus-veneris]
MNKLSLDKEHLMQELLQGLKQLEGPKSEHRFSASGQRLQLLSTVLLPLPKALKKKRPPAKQFAGSGKVKNRATPVNLPVKLIKSEAILSEGVVLFSIILNKPLKASEPTLMDTTSFKLPSNPRIESYTKVNPVKLADAEIKYGPYENIPAFSSLPITVHYENNQPFVVVEELVQEIEISNWGNIYVTENYQLTHGGAKHKGGFSRLDFQARPGISGRASPRGLQACLPPRAYSVYYRDEIGNVSTSHLHLDKDKTELLFEPRCPLLGGWHVTFTIGYGVPLQDFVFRAADGQRYLRFPFGCPIQDVVVKKLVVTVVLPEGSKEPSVQVPFTVEESNEVKYSYLDSVGRIVVVLTKKNVVQEHNVFFEIYFKFNPMAMLVEPLMLVTGFFLFSIAYVAYARLEFSISKSSASYQARIQRAELIDVVGRTALIAGYARHGQRVKSRRCPASLMQGASTTDVQSRGTPLKHYDRYLILSRWAFNAPHGMHRLQSPQSTHRDPPDFKLHQEKT